MEKRHPRGVTTDLWDGGGGRGRNNGKTSPTRGHNWPFRCLDCSNCSIISYWQDKATFRSNTKCCLRSSEERYFYWTYLHSSIYACKTFHFSWLKTISNSHTAEWIIYQYMIEPFFWNLTRPSKLTFTLEESQEKKWRTDSGSTDNLHLRIVVVWSNNSWRGCRVAPLVSYLRYLGSVKDRYFKEGERRL